MYRSTKTFGHELGLSCAFRQWRAKSHCNQLHGYALSFKFVFEAKDLDDRNWVVDFGGLKSLRHGLETLFDHTTVIANDDPELWRFKELHQASVIDLRTLDNVGCEMFAHTAYHIALDKLDNLGLLGRVKIISCECSEHGANSAIYFGD